MFRSPVLRGVTDFWIRWRVRVGYPVGIAAFWFAKPESNWLLGGAAIGALGLLLRGWAAGHLRKHQQLATGGPYAYTRNPLYLGSIFLAAGFCVASHSWISAALVSVYLAVFYPMVMRREKRELETLYGRAFIEYAALVPAFFPRLSPAMRSDERFSRAIYAQNREYEASIGFALALIVLWALLLWRY